MLGSLFTRAAAVFLPEMFLWQPMPRRSPLCRAYTLKASKIRSTSRLCSTTPVPDVFDTAFLAKSGFRYAIDRTFIDILKGLGFLTDAGQARRYADFHDRRQAGALLRRGDGRSPRRPAGRALQKPPPVPSGRSRKL